MTLHDAATRVALLRLIDDSDEDRVRALVEATEAVEGATVADVVCACAVLLADVLSDLHDDAAVQAAAWAAIQVLVLEHLKADDVMEGSGGPLN